MDLEVLSCLSFFLSFFPKHASGSPPRSRTVVQRDDLETCDLGDDDLDF